MFSCIDRIMVVGVAVAACIHAGTAAANPSVTRVVLDTTPLVDHPAGPFSIVVSLTDGSGLGDGNTTVRMADIDLGGGAALQDVALVGGASGDLQAGITLSDSASPTLLAQSFMPGTRLRFTVALTTEYRGAETPDGLTIALLDQSGVPVATASPAGDFLFSLDAGAALGLPRSYPTDPSRPPALGDPIVMGAAIFAVEESLNRFAVLAAEEVRLAARSAIITGDVGANAGSRRNRGFEVRVGAGAAVFHPMSRVVGDTVRLGPGATVNNVVANAVVNRGADVMGAVSKPDALPFVELRSPLPVLSGRRDVAVRPLTGKVLAAGRYRDVDVGRRGTLTLTGGVYHFRSLALDGGASVIVTRPTELRIGRELSAEARSRLVPDPAVPGLTAAHLRVFVDGVDRNCVHGRGGHDDGDGPAAVHVGASTVIQANVYAPRATIRLKRGTVVTGSLVGRRIQAGPDAEISLVSGIE
jgi:hypothetical protein